MARVRPLYPGQWSDDEFVPMSFEARLLCLGIRNYADDNGIIEWQPLKLKMNIFPADNLDVAPLMAELLTHRHVFRYEIDGKLYGLIRNFHKWNHPDRPGYYHPPPSDGDVPEIALRRLVMPSEIDRRPVGDKSEIDRRPVGDKSEIDRRPVGDILGGGGGGGGRGRDRGGGHARAQEVKSPIVDNPVDKPSAAASFSLSKKKTPRRSAAKSGLPDPIPFKTFPAISHQQIKSWAMEFGRPDNAEGYNEILRHLIDLDKKFTAGKMEKPIGNPIKNLHALLRKRYGH